MTDSKKKVSTEADDVFEFLDSLPQSNSLTNATNSTKTSQKRDVSEQNGPLTAGDGVDATQNKEDILEFLEELEKSTTTATTNTNNNNNNSNDTTSRDKIIKQVKKKTDNYDPSVKESMKKDEDSDMAGAGTLKNAKMDDIDMKDREDSPLNDPITSFTNWWSKSGSDKVSKIWNRTQDKASQFRDKLIENDTMLPVVNLSNLKNNLNTNNLLNLTDQITKNLTKIVVGDTEEVLRIHLVHDLINLSYLQYYVEEKFDQVMSSQVEGGIRIFVDEWGKPNSNTINKDDNGNADDNSNSNSDSGINNESRQKIDMNLFQGKINDGDKLAFANLDNSIELFNKAHEAILQQQQNQIVNKNDNKNISDIFISILPISTLSTHSDNNNNIDDDDDKSDEIIKTIDTTSPNNFHFTVVLKDISNNITCIARSQSFPLKWLHWLQGSRIQAVGVKKSGSEDDEENKDEDEEEEMEVDPSEWVQQWIEDGIALVIGVVAQNYVIERMGF